MKKIALFFFSLFFFFVIGFTIAQIHPKIGSFLFKQDLPFRSFKPTPYPLKNQPFAIVVIGYNNGANVDKTLRSILSQNYENFRVIYIDDASNDGSFHQARDEIYESGGAHRVFLVQNEKPLGFTANLVRAVEICNEDEIVVVVSGEDLLSHEWVLQKLNQYYANPNLWMTFGKALEHPTFTLKSSLSEIEFEDPRKNSLPPLHLKTFYASLFKKIQENDLMIHGEFLPEFGESAYMIPLLEMAKGHVQYLDEVLYLVTKHPDVDVDLQTQLNTSLHEKSAYRPISQLFEKNL